MGHLSWTTAVSDANQAKALAAQLATQDAFWTLAASRLSESRWMSPRPAVSEIAHAAAAAVQGDKSKVTSKAAHGRAAAPPFPQASGTQTALGHDGAGPSRLRCAGSCGRNATKHPEEEKDQFEEEEADDLINFVEGLDFDKYAAA